MGTHYALLIGVDYYFPNRLPNGGGYASLRGSVRDVLQVEQYLTSRLHLSPDQILKLTASDAGGRPLEPPDQWPTYANMVAAFKRLTEMAQPGDQLYIHYSGHGGRAATIFPQLKGESGLDEALVPTDIGNAGGQYLRDVELAYLLQAMVDKGLIVTLVLDSCHAGGATRGVASRVRVRGIGRIDTTPRPSDSLVASPAELAAVWQHQTGVTATTRAHTRALKPASGWLVEPRGYILLAACRASESAYEYAPDGQAEHGALTYWLLDSLRQAGPATTYQQVHARVLAKVHGVFSLQTPQLQGEGNRSVFGSERLQPVYAVPVLQINSSRDQVRLGAGKAQGLQVGAQFALYPHDAELTQAGPPAAVVEVSRLADVDAWANVAPGQRMEGIEEGAQAVLLATGEVTLQRQVAVVLDEAALRRQVEQAIAGEGKGFVVVAEADAQPDFQVALNAAGEFEILDKAGVPVPHLRPPLRADEQESLSRLVARLVHLAKFRNVQALEMPDPLASAWLRVELSGSSEADGDLPNENVPVFRPGQLVTLRITNTQAAGIANDPSRILNITVLDLASDWSIRQVYPAGAAAFEPLDPGQTLSLSFVAEAPAGYDEVEDHLKVFATQATTEFRWLELPPLDQPPDPQPVLRRASADPLERVLAQVTGNQVQQRALSLVTRPHARWTVVPVLLRVRRASVDEPSMLRGSDLFPRS